jgi:hypothetical protein
MVHLLDRLLIVLLAYRLCCRPQLVADCFPAAAPLRATINQRVPAGLHLPLENCIGALGLGKCHGLSHGSGVPAPVQAGQRGGWQPVDCTAVGKRQPLAHLSHTISFELKPRTGAESAAESTGRAPRLGRYKYPFERMRGSGPPQQALMRRRQQQLEHTASLCRSFDGAGWPVGLR